jgi:hypothetical protein
MDPATQLRKVKIGPESTERLYSKLKISLIPVYQFFVTEL